MARQSTDSAYLKKLPFDPALLHSFMAKLIDNVRLVFLAILTIVIAGGYAFVSLPRELNPEVDIPLVTVVTPLPGASPTDVERLVTKPIEAELLTLSGLDTLNSFSNENVSIVQAQFGSNEDPDTALAKVKERVDIVKPELPASSEEPTVNKLDFNDQPVWTVSLTGPFDRVKLTSLAKEIEKKLEDLREIRKVELSGNSTEELVVEVSAATLQEYGIAAESIQATLGTDNVAVPAGRIQVSGLEYGLSLDGELVGVESVRALPVAGTGGVVSLGEVAQVYIRTADTDEFAFARIDEDTRWAAVSLTIFKADSATIQQSVEAAQAVLEEEVQAVPALQLIDVLNNASEVNASFDELRSNFTTTILLVFIVLMLFIGLRQASIASLAIPLTFLSSFTVMAVLGVTLNFLSLFSLLLALGLVVDDAIVIVQAYSRYNLKFPPKQAGLLVYRDFVVPIWTTTLTTVWAFVPLLLSTGIIGEFISSIPVVVTATLLSSTTIAVLINIPLSVQLTGVRLPKRLRYSLIGLGGLALVLAVVVLTAGNPIQPLLVGLWLVILLALLLSRKQVLASISNRVDLSTIKNYRLTQGVGRFVSRLAQPSGVIAFTPIMLAYRKLLGKTIRSKRLRRRVYVLSGAFLLISILFLVSGWLKVEFFPKTDSENVYINIEAPPGTNSLDTIELTEKIERLVIGIPEVSRVTSQTARTFDVNGASSTGANTALTSVVLQDADDRDRSSNEIANEMRETLASLRDVKADVQEASGGPPAGADFQANIRGDDLAVLEEIADEFARKLRDIPGAINIRTSLTPSPGKVQVNLDRVALKERGLSAIQVGGWLRTAVTGVESGAILVSGDDISIRVRLVEDERTLSHLHNTPLPSQLGAYTLGEVATLSLENSPASIERENGERVVRVTATADGVSAPTLLASFNQTVADYDLPTGYSWDVGGANEENIESTQSIIQAMGVSVVLILLTVVLQLGSFRKAALVLSVIPMAVAGVFFNFTIFGIPLSFPALIGVLALFGIVVNNSIMLMEKINRNLDVGFSFFEALTDGCASRLEPIVLTSLTTAIGLFPITVSDPLWRGLGGAIIAGLSVSGALILFLLPVLYTSVFAPRALLKK